MAIDELHKRKMTPDERFAYERTMAINAEAIRVVNAQVEKARIKEKTENQKVDTVKMFWAGKLTVAEIADYTDLSIEEVKHLQRDLETMN